MALSNPVPITQTSDAARLSPGLVSALNGLRAIAAFYVVAYHVDRLQASIPGDQLFKFGQEAVLAFFLLSGFVIYANERERALRPRGYYLRRIRRIYPPLFVAFLVSTIVFAANGTLGQNFDLGALLGTTFGLQDSDFIKPGVITDPYLRNDPLWSLSYELFFYAVFPVLIRLRAEVTTCVGIVAVVAYATYLAVPNHLSLVLSYMLVWWAGAALARLYLATGSLRVWALRREIGWLAALIVVAAVGVVIDGRHGLGYYPELQVRHFAIGLLFLLLATSPLARIFARQTVKAAAPVATLASISYGVYVVHYPLMVQWDQSRTRLGFVVAFALLIVAAIVSDRVLPALLPAAPKR